MRQRGMMRPGPTGKVHSAYAMRQAKRFKDQGLKLPEIAQRMGVTQHDVRQLLKAEAKIVETRLAPVIHPVPQSDNTAGRSYALAPRRSA